VYIFPSAKSGSCVSSKAFRRPVGNF
jgi:hypothetical protein